MPQYHSGVTGCCCLCFALNSTRSDWHGYDCLLVLVLVPRKPLLHFATQIVLSSAAASLLAPPHLFWFSQLAESDGFAMSTIGLSGVVPCVPKLWRLQRDPQSCEVIHVTGCVHPSALIPELTSSFLSWLKFGASKSTFGLGR